MVTFVTAMSHRSALLAFLAQQCHRMSLCVFQGSLIIKVIRDGPLEKSWRGRGDGWAKYQKNSCKGKLSLKNVMHSE